jgi:hypothetical protein
MSLHHHQVVLLPDEILCLDSMTLGFPVTKGERIYSDTEIPWLAGSPSLLQLVNLVVPISGVSITIQR